MPEGGAGRGGTGGSNDGGAGSGGTGGGGGGEMDGGMDAAVDAGADSATGDEGGLVYYDATVEDAGPPPDDWSCPEALWADGVCDCGCSTTDYDCNQVANCITPGCVLDTCGACFTADGAWKACAPAPDPSLWTCDPLLRGDGSCDCGCGIPDPDCQGNGCEHPACYEDACARRHGCGAPNTAVADDCNGVPPSILIGTAWDCPDGNYGSGDGCDCGCGVIDPDCGGLGCTTARCFEAACATCHAEDGVPYSCAAAEAGWDEQILESGGSNPSLCNGTHFDADDGCDCGCGGHDPDCGDDGCDEPGCIDAECVRCTDPNGNPTGCLDQSDLGVWRDTYHCDPKDYGTGNGCDCGCGVPDPDCGAAGCTEAGCGDDQDLGCDVCNDGSGFYVECEGWTCEDAAAMADSDCDCGCGVIDPACRDFNKLSCTEPGCRTEVCDRCNAEGEPRSLCEGAWDTGDCGVATYGLDGLCDCGCGALDPDCEEGAGCIESGCAAPGCEVCHAANQLVACPFWTCAPEAYGDGETCDCGCGGSDPDCGINGCEAPGCGDPTDSCDVCHDPYGRPVPCP